MVEHGWKTWLRGTHFTVCYGNSQSGVIIGLWLLSDGAETERAIQNIMNDFLAVPGKVVFFVTMFYWVLFQEGERPLIIKMMSGW